MTKLQLLHRALNERLMAAVEQIMEMVGDTVLEYEEETIRARKENEVLRRRLRWMEGANRADWPGPSEPVMLSTMDEANPSRQDECAANFGFVQQSESLEIKTESTDLPLCIRPESSVTTFPQSIDQGSDNAGTGAGIAYGLTDSMTWDSGQSYMAPLDFDPTSGPSRVRRWRGRNRRQRMSFACPDCGKVFGREQRLMVHMRIHSTERPYAYRRRKACFYGDNRKKRKLHRLSQLSREIVDDLSDGSEQTNRSSASPEQLETTAPGQEEEPESDHTSSDKEPEKRITTSVRNQHEKKVVNQMCQCPHCPHRVFARPCQLAMHMKTHTVTTHVNRPTQAQSGTREIVDVNRILPKRQRKKNVEKKAKVADKHEHHCPDCDRVFSYASRLRFHMKSHNSKKALLRKTLPIKTEVTKEDTTEAELKKTYACPHCDKLFTREGWLGPHIRSQHKEVKNRSDYVNMFASRRTRAQQPFTMQFRKRTTTKWGEVTKDPRLKNQKTKESRRVKAELLQTNDESILDVDVSTITNDEAEQSADPPIMSTDEAEQSEDLLKTGTNKAEQSEDLLKTGTDEAEQSEDLLKTGTNEAEQSEDLLKTGTNEAEQSEDLLKTGTDEAEQSEDLLKTGTDEAEQSEDLLKTGTNEGQQSADLPKTGTDESENPSEQSNLKKMFPCKTCGKEFVMEKRLKKHSRKHIGHKLQNEKKRKRAQALMETELEEQETRRSEGKERLDDKMSSNHNPNTAMPQGSPKKEALQKTKSRGQGPLPCPFCGKVFAWEMRLLMHMQIHCGEKPYAYRQRKRRFYGDLKRGQLPKIHSQEGPACQTNSTDDNSSEFKIHHCFYCNQPHNRMMDHLQSVHPNEPEVAKALTFDKSSQEREQLLNLLQTRGNVLHNTNVVQSSKQDLKPFGKDKSAQNAEYSCGEMLPIAGPIPPAPTLISPSSSEEIDAKIEPSGFHCLNTIYETDFENEQGSSSNPDLSCNEEQPDISSPNDEVRNGRKAEGAFLQFRHSPENEVGYELKSDNSPNPSTAQEPTDCMNEGVSLPKCDVDQERAMTPTSDTSPHPEYDVLRNPYDDFSPPENAQTLSYDTQKSSVKAQTCETGKKRCSRVDNQPLIKDDDLVGEGEMSNSELHVCQHCKATFGSPYMLHRHEHTHTGDTPSSADQEKLKRAKRLIQDVETSMMDEASIEPSTKSPEDLPNAVTDDTGEKLQP
ncbi:zinc finger protein Xfin-like isoform X2 [Carassius carassius]|uniref:zinc finger protein Xfin-like isoform X2 n=1 Tax=Carassius carassius TaxID=217509 RepID=UPI002868AFD8|nr:zinc finger protein Xfin-like isoform X2 [Carassius carassius]